MSQSTFTLDAPRSQDRTLAAGPVLPDGPMASVPLSGVVLDGTRARQTERPVTPFRDLLAGGVSVLMGGAAVATHVLGAPRLAAAIAGAESRASNALVGTPAALGGRVAMAASAGVSASGNGAAALPAGTGSDAGDFASMAAMQRESQMFNMQLLGLQEQVQQDSQRFTTLSNVMRAKHDTAKAAVSNIRS